MTDQFTLDGFRAPVTVDLAKKITKEKLLKFSAFCNWKDTLQKNLELQYTDRNHPYFEDPYLLRSIEIQSADYFGPSKVGFVKLKAYIRNQNWGQLPGIILLRGGSVAMLMVLRPVDSRDERWVVMTEQARVATGSLMFVELPTGLLDDAGDFWGAAAKEIEEETGFKLPKHELIDLTELALSQSKPEGDHSTDEALLDAVYPSPGGSDEFISILLWEKDLSRQEIMDLRGKLNGIRGQGKSIRLRVCDYEDLRRHYIRDTKTLAAWALYEGLMREGKIETELLKHRKLQDDRLA
ncbi:nudix hydrolase 14 [Alternaria rosae]|uniref:nudix hydrolase 14 n=1 Tax=Alternaria rosae TaxID=1187941 RepID=UPI001E8E796E|nr:nudix hydrolase 14 [Alternaria rosae]KAH6875260.1 nudix hydrolase 14 [Alternaria rosae]